MKKLLIVYPNWLPSNSVGAQRVRLIVNYLHEFGWEPVLITVHSKYYEEEPCYDLLRTIRVDIKTEYVEAKQAYPLIRLYGDISLRAFGTMKKKALEVIRNNRIDFIWLPIPPFYTALLGRMLHEKTGIPYGIDYIDPWVHQFPGSKKLFSRAKLSSFIARVLEPYAVKKASFLTGVSAPYFLPVFDRNPHLKGIPYAGMPYGFDSNDYKVVPTQSKLLWHDKSSDTVPLIYAGAFLPNAHLFIDVLFKVISQCRKGGLLNKSVVLYFVGTGTSQASSIHDFAVKHNIADIVVESKERISYLEVLHNLSNAAGILAIGSTEVHYTASKIFQAILSQKPVFAIFHHLSSVIPILEETRTDNYLVKYSETETIAALEMVVEKSFLAFLDNQQLWAPDYLALEKYSARCSAKALADVLNKSMDKAS